MAYYRRVPIRRPLSRPPAPPVASQRKKTESIPVSRPLTPIQGYIRARMQQLQTATANDAACVDGVRTAKGITRNKDINLRYKLTNINLVD
eukprot:m.158826 g.158826  ORF g.158826 m.158826 type:complete len:91 (+) comp38751_c0_seq1:1609-1881(+)